MLAAVFCGQQVGEARQHFESVAVLVQASITNLIVSEHSLHIAKRVLNLGAYLALELFHFCLVAFRVYRLSFTGLLGDIPFDWTVSMGFSLLDTPVAGVTRNSLLFSVKKLVDSFKIVRVGRRGFQSVDQAYLIVHTDMELHAEIPLVSFAGLMHLRIPLLLGIFR